MHVLCVMSVYTSYWGGGVAAYWKLHIVVYGIQISIWYNVGTCFIYN